LASFLHLAGVAWKEVEAVGGGSGLKAVRYAQLCDDVRDVDADSALGDEQPSGDLLVRVAPGEHQEDVSFARRQRYRELGRGPKSGCSRITHLGWASCQRIRGHSCMPRQCAQ